MADSSLYVHHVIACAPRSYAAAARNLCAIDWGRHGAALYGVWRSQIGRPRDEVNAMTVWTGDPDLTVMSKLIESVSEVRHVTSEPLRATLRPTSPAPPRRQGNYAFRWFELREPTGRNSWASRPAACSSGLPTRRSSVCGAAQRTSRGGGALYYSSPAGPTWPCGSAPRSGRRRRERGAAPVEPPLRSLR